MHVMQIIKKVSDNIWVRDVVFGASPCKYLNLKNFSVENIIFNVSILNGKFLYFKGKINFKIWKYPTPL